VQRFATGPVIVVLAAFAAYILVTTTQIALTNGGPATFWLSIALLYLFAAGAAWASYRLYRLRAAKRRGPLTKG
jgi:hypothetical protein